MAAAASSWSIVGTHGRWVRLAAAAFMVAVLYGCLQIFPLAPSAPGGDGWNYLAAGERLNAGHALYALGSGDRPVTIVPPFWTTPLLSPPPIAVLWRPLAVVGEASMTIWWLGGAVAMTALVGWILARGQAWTILGLMFLSPAVILTAMSGNANAYLVPLLAVAWIRRDRPALAGIATPIVAAVKVTPILLLPWAVQRSGWRPILVTTLALAIWTVLGAGPTSPVDWLVGNAHAGPSPLSVSTTLGVPSWVVSGACVAATAVLWWTCRARERILFSGGLALAVVGTPALYFEALALLLPIAIALGEAPGVSDRLTAGAPRAPVAPLGRPPS